MEQVLVMETNGSGLRSEAHGWTAEDPRNVVPGKPIGYSPSWRGNGFFTYDCPLRALADGWRLLAPPTQHGDVHEWWLVREVPRG